MQQERQSSVLWTEELWPVARVAPFEAQASAQQAAGDLDGARATLEALKAQFPNNQQIQRRLDELAKPR